MIKYHNSENAIIFAEILPGSERINSADEMLDIMAEAGYNDSAGIIIHHETLHPDFFDLKSGLAGAILQKFSNYRMKLAIIGDLSEYKSKSLKDFIWESNKLGTICFVESADQALSRLSRH
jgi:hypothetical protein